MPWFSYHGGHSGDFCRHAKGSLDDVVRRAVEAGFTHYGLSEHCPRYREQDRFPDEQDLSVEDLSSIFEAYGREAHALSEEYADRIEILVGFETEILPPEDWAPRMRALRAAGGFEYVIGSVHHVESIPIDSTPALTEEASELCGGKTVLANRYFDDLAAMVTELRPEIVGHFDLIRKFEGDDAGFAPEVGPAIERALEAVREAGSALDINAGAYRRGLSPVYPLPDILARACEMEIPVTLGDDSHGAHDVGVGLDACMSAICEAGYREVSYLTRRDGVATRVAAPIDQVRPEVVA